MTGKWVYFKTSEEADEFREKAKGKYTTIKKMRYQDGRRYWGIYLLPKEDTDAKM